MRRDVSMYEDAIKTPGYEGEIALRELSESVLEAFNLTPEVRGDANWHVKTSRKDGANDPDR
jgi:hypothetical protein